MPRSNRLRPAGLLAASVGLVAAACGTDTIDLLPLSAGASSAEAGSGNGGQTLGGHGPTGHGGKEFTAGSAGASGGRSGMGGRPSVSAGDGGSAGSFQNGGKGGGYCAGFACGGTTSGAGGSVDPRCPDPNPNSPWCTSCQGSTDCPPQFSCNGYIGFCRPTCMSGLECPNDGVCDAMYSTCIACFDDDQCAAEGNPKRRACEFGRCVECNEHVDCPRGSCHSLQCLICNDDKDCTGGRRCDKTQGRCL